MSNLSSSEKLKLEKLFGMSSGYVIDFSNRTFGEFICENVGIDIFKDLYNYESGSKANRLRAFWKKEENAIVGKLLMRLLEYWKLKHELDSQIVTISEKNLYEECMKITERLIQTDIDNNRENQEIGLTQNATKVKNKENQLNLLLSMFDELSTFNDHQKRGYILQDLLHQLFIIHEIPVTRSFLRNDGGEQIDGAFAFQSWHYLVECKWTKKLTDIRELDSLLAKVNRGGRQAMGLFLSIEGWSINVPPLLKQNPDKCLILMEGYDLRSVLNGTIILDDLLNAKIAKLNNDSEPFYSVVEILKTKNRKF